MTYNLTEDQETLRKTIGRFANEKVSPLAEEIEHSGDYPDELIGMMNELGIMGLPYEEKYGGGGADLLTMSIAMEELAKVCANTAMVPITQELGAMPIVVMGNEEQKEKYLSKIATGEYRIAFALTEPDAGSDVASMKSTAVRDGDNYILNGAKRFISYADVADVFSFFAKTDISQGNNGISSFIVERNTPGITIGKKKIKWVLKDFLLVKYFLIMSLYQKLIY